MSKEITREELINLLNKDLEWEYAASIQYVQHASVITGPNYKSIQAELIVHSNEELVHAQMISEQIAYLGGIPTMEVEKRLTSKDSAELIRQDVKGELDAINGYKERIGQAEALKEYGLRRVLEDILIQEEEHYRDLATMLE